MQGDSEKHQGGIASVLSLEMLAGPLCNPFCWQAVDLIVTRSVSEGFEA